ncbi:unnamed protein product [Rotaria sordida]|uniref:DED domain-containing protein n=1 Tax=Rotaria sordida TaxID=392033 RepID=A0A814Q9Z8_9BILA|nr:unnamed protein product [Rotaria sordida]
MDNHRLRAMILKLQDRLSNDDRKRLHFYLGNDVPRRIRDDPSLGGTLSLMDSLFDQDKINENDFTFLINAFDEIQCIDAMKLLREYWRQNQSNGLNQSIESLSMIMPSMMSQLVEDQDEDKYPIPHHLVNQQNSCGSNNIVINTRSVPYIDFNARWTKYGVTVAGGNGAGDELDKFNQPWGFYLDNDQTLYIVDLRGYRIVEWKPGATSGRVVAGGNGEGNRTDQLNLPVDVTIDEDKDSFIISDYGNQRVMRWPRRNGTSGEVIISNIDCWGVAMDDQGFLYVSDVGKSAVRRFQVGEPHETIVAGGNGKGDRLNQLNNPTHIFIDHDQSIYVSDSGNDRVMKWIKGATEGVVVAGGRGRGSDLTQLSNPRGVFVDLSGTVYVSDHWNHRIMRWIKGMTQGSIIVGESGQGDKADQLKFPFDLSLDQSGNLYVVDEWNRRVQRFNIEKN